MSRVFASIILVLLLIVTGFLIWVVAFNGYYFQTSESEKNNFSKGGLVLVESSSGGEILSDRISDRNLVDDGFVEYTDLCDEYGLCEDDGGSRRNREDTEDECSSTSNCGEDYYSKDYCYFGNVYRNFYDYSCEDGNCEKDSSREFVESCEFGCNEDFGVCEYECYDNSDCGEDKYVSEKSCSGGPNGDVYRDLLQGVCANPGTALSECVYSINPVVVEDCKNSCVNGNCVECAEDGDCCEDYYEDNYCFNDDVYRDWINFYCDENNDCQFIVESELFEDCTSLEGCWDGGCVVLPVDSDEDGYDNSDSSNPFDDDNEVDCNDADASVNPGAFEVCDGKDNDCNGVVDEGCPVDNDNDGYDNANPGDFGDDGLPRDCNDNNANVNPGALEACNGVDDDCDGVVDEGDGGCGAGSVCVLSSCYVLPVDADGDGYDNANPGDFGDDGLPKDCNDNNANVNPGALEACNGVDDDCDGVVDEGGDDYCGNGEVCYQGQCEEVTCNFDFQCGFSDFIGNRVCQNGDVWEDFKDYSCNNPGTGSSECSFSIYKKLSDECDIGCYEGECINEICDDNVDNDGDGLVDGLVEVFGIGDQVQVNMPSTKSMSGCGLYSNVKEDIIKDIPNLDSIFGVGTGYSDETSERICNMLGYGDYDSMYWHGYSYPFDENVVFFDKNQGKWIVRDNTWNVVGGCNKRLRCFNPLPRCSNNLDDDGDGLVDMDDPACSNANDQDERGPIAACGNGLDDDGDGLVDMNDLGCNSLNDNSEVGHDIECVFGYFK